MDLHELRASVLSAAQLAARGVGRAKLRSCVAEGSLIVVHRGWYVDAATWRSWFSETRHAAASLAVFFAMRGRGLVLSHVSAAVLWGLPLYRVTPRRVHVAGPCANGNTKASRVVARHVTDLEGAVAEVDGVPVTTLMRTVADIIGQLPLTAAVALADAAMRKIAWDEETLTYDEDAAERWRAELLVHPSLRAGARGSVQGRWVAAFADGRAESPLESVSRLYLHQLGFAKPRLQVRVDHANGHFRLDFSLDDVDVWGECDGAVKYLDPELLGDSTTARALLAEKAREDEVRGRTRRGIIRWGAAELRDLETYRRHLASLHVHPSGAPGQIPRARRGREL